MNNYEQTTQQYIKMIDDALEKYIVTTGQEYDIVKEAMLYSLKAGGKRVRPILVLEFCRMCGGDIRRALPFACAIEMVHCYSLIHDDLPCMDDDDMRRGKPSCHKQFGEANALLAGDALLTQAFHVIACAMENDGVSPIACIKAAKTLSYYAGAEGMIGGQVMDLKYENQPMTEQILRQIHFNKTAALIKSACLMGVLVADGTEKDMKLAEEYAHALGLAFQIIDDILDVVGTVDTLGKPAGSDAENGKSTFVTIYGLERANQIATETTAKALGLLDDFADNQYLKQMTNNLLKRANQKR